MFFRTVNKEIQLIWGGKPAAHGNRAEARHRDNGYTQREVCSYYVTYISKPDCGLTNRTITYSLTTHTHTPLDCWSSAPPSGLNPNWTVCPSSPHREVVFGLEVAVYVDARSVKLGHLRAGLDGPGMEGEHDSVVEINIIYQSCKIKIIF